MSTTTDPAVAVGYAIRNGVTREQADQGPTTQKLLAQAEADKQAKLQALTQGRYVNF